MNCGAWLAVFVLVRTTARNWYVVEGRSPCTAMRTGTSAVPPPMPVIEVAEP